MINTYPTEVITVIDTYHDLVHKGKYFSGGYYDAALVNAGVLDLLLQSSSAHLSHAKSAVAASGDCVINIYEDTTFSSAGAAVTMTNHNRASADVFSGTVTSNPTVTSVGTILDGTGFLPGGTKHTGGGGEFGFNNEFVFAKSKNYLIRVTNVSGVTIKISAMIEIVQSTL